MKKLLFFLAAILTFSNISAQMLDPVKWTTKLEKISDNEFNLIFTGNIDDQWHVYSQFTPDGGPLPLELLFKDAKGNFQLVGRASESKTERAFNDIFGVDEIFFSKKAVITQKVQIINNKLKAINVALEYQVCKDVCINQSKNFTFKLPQITKAAEDVGPTTSLDTTSAVAVDPVEITPQVTAAQQKILDPEKSASSKLWYIFILAFVAGLAALLTPCVFPLIPMTVSFFTKQSKT
jgi:thiol:disulfide interchange protein DsbD